MTDEFETFEESTEDTTPEEVTPPPRYVDENLLDTRLGAFEERIMQAFQSVAPKRPVVPEEEDPDKDYYKEFGAKLAKHGGLDPEQVASQAEQRAYARALEGQKPGMIREMLQECQVTDPNIRKAITEKLGKFSGLALAQMATDSNTLEELKLMADGLTHRATTKAAPRSSGSGTVGGANSEVTELANEYWQNYKHIPGYTKEKALEMAKKRVV